MKRMVFMAVLAVLALVFVSGAYADTISIGLQEGGGITTVASGPSPQSFTGSFGTFSQVSVSGVGTFSLNLPSLGSQTIDVASSGIAGTLNVWVTDTGITSPTGLTAFLSSFTSQLLPLGWTVTTSTYVDNSNAAYGTATLLNSSTFATIGAFVGTNSATTASPYSATELFVITANTTSGVTNDTIQLSAMPEPGTLALFGSGLISLVGLRRRKLLQA